MPQEMLLADFRGGMDAVSAVDKLDPTSCLLADGVRLDETGDVLSEGAVTSQNSTALSDTLGNTNIHSLFFSPNIGAISGVGQDVYQGPTLGGQSRVLIGANITQQKMSFVPAPTRIYFDVGSTGYWSDFSNLLTVDWAPPNVSSGVAIVSGPNLVGTATQSGTGTAWTNTTGITGTTSFAVATVGTYALGYPTKFLIGTGAGFAVNTSSTVSGVIITVEAKFVKTGGSHNAATIGANLIVGGIPTGVYAQTPNLTSTLGTYTFGTPSYLWNIFGGITPAQVNSSSFGVQLFGLVDGATAGIFSVRNARLTVYQSPAGLTAGIGGAGALTGTYTWKVTFVGTYGEESDASSDSNAVILAGQAGTLTGIPTGDSRTASRNIYRKGGALTSYYLVGSIPDNSSTTFNDGFFTDTAALAEGVILAGDVQGDFPNSRLGGTQVRFPALHYERVFWIVPGTNKIIWSKPLNGFAYPSINFFNVGDARPITRIVSIFGELIIIKTDSIWRLTGTDESSFSLSQTPSAVGTDIPFSIVVLPDRIIFANRWGLWFFNGYTSTPVTNKLDLWFKQDNRTNKSLFGISGFNPLDVTSTTLNYEMVGNADKVYWIYTEAAAGRNNSTLVFDFKHKNITKRGSLDSIIDNPLSLTIDPVTGYVYVGGDDGFIYLQDDWNSSSAGNFDFQTGYVDLQRGSNKTLWALEFFINTNGQSLTPYVYYDGGAASETLAAISTTGLERVLRPVESTTARKMQNFSVRLGGSVSPVVKSGQPQIQLVHIKPYYDLRMGRARTGQ